MFHKCQKYAEGKDREANREESQKDFDALDRHRGKKRKKVKRLFSCGWSGEAHMVCTDLL